MEISRIVAKTIETGFGENPNWMAMVASSQGESVEIVFETMQAPIIASSIVASSQEAAKRMKPGTLHHELVWNFNDSRRSAPEAIDISLVADGEVLCVNVGSGALFFRLSETAKQSINNLREF